MNRYNYIHIKSEIVAQYLNVASNCCATVPQATLIDWRLDGLHAMFAVREISFTFILIDLDIALQKIHYSSKSK